MKLFRVAAVVGLGVLSTGGCTGDGTGPIDEALLEFVGAWRATKFEYVSQDESHYRVNLASLGRSVTLTINPDGDWTLLIARPGMFQYQVSTGTMLVRPDSIILQWDGYSEPMSFVFDLSDDTLTMSTSEAQYDFDTDGAREPADLEMTLLRL